ncbi:MAG: Vitamin B12 dependent methionine synthase activation domain [Anaerolineaceae bacterium]|nr:MAG: Vitamin B12 dependent methionine synthase activation domain [Anaerolineaceae bacterium]
MEIWTDFSFTLSLDDILRGEGADPELARKKRPALVKAASAAGHLGFTTLRPAAAIREVKVIEHRHDQILLAGGKKLTGPLAARHLAGAERVAAVVCTIGAELETLASAQEDLVLALALDGLGNAAVEAVSQQVCGRIAERARAKGLETSAPLSPGEPDWPVDAGQPQIFSLLGQSPAGVRLTEGWMMIPMKSISFVVGIGPHMEQADLCELCSMKERCRYRKA